MDPMIPVQIAYGGLSFFISSLNNIFIIFYMSTFIYAFKIDSKSFLIGETLFFIWNSINDPLFGWISDQNTISGNNQDNSRSIVLRKLNRLSKYGPLFAISFLLFWFELFPVSIQFSLALCFYDSFLTMVDLQHQSLLADLFVESKDRVVLNTYCSIFSAIGTITLFIAFMLWDKLNLFPFQFFCISLVLFTIIGFQVCCYTMKQYYKAKEYKKTFEKQQEEPKQEEMNKTMAESRLTALKKYTKQLIHHKNFLLFSVMNLVQVFHCHFNSNFFPFIVQELLGQAITLQSGAFLLILSFLLPYLNNLYLLQLCRRHGTYFVIKILLVVKLILGCIMWTIGTKYWILLCLFISSNRIFTEGICRLLNLIITDLVDEDYVKFNRTSPVSALIFGTAALFSKPGQTLAPLLGSYLIYLNTGKSIFLDRVNKSNKANDFFNSNAAKDGCFRVVVFLPIFCAVIQLITWHFFTLHGSYLENVKKERVNSEEEKQNTGILV